jgi:DNA mismatch endonuclease, patch repair protein
VTLHRSSQQSPSINCNLIGFLTMTLPPFKRPAEKRSQNMRAIRSFGTKTTEKRLASLLREHRIRGWRSQPRNIAGKPDFVVQRRRVAVFVDGCFFHGCPHCGHIPWTNRAYWTAKIARNRRRDLMVSKALKELGYRVVRIWECQLRSKAERCLGRILHELKRKPEKQGKTLPRA